MATLNYRSVLPEYKAPDFEIHDGLHDAVGAFFENVSRIYDLWRVCRSSYIAGLRQSLVLVAHHGTAIDEDAIFEDAIKHNEAGFRTLIMSQVISAWTAFEVLTKDLWVAALNRGPKSAAEAVFRAQSKAGRLKTEGEETKQQEKMIPISSLAKYGYDLRESMGDLLLAEKKVDFLSLGSTMAAYNAAFGEAAKAVFVKPGNAEVAALEYIRNAAVHAGGKVDYRYAGIRKRFPSLPEADVGAVLPMDGLLAGMLIAAALQTSNVLIEFVNAWMLAPPVKPTLDAAG